MISRVPRTSPWAAGADAAGAEAAGAEAAGAEAVGAAAVPSLGWAEAPAEGTAESPAGDAAGADVQAAVPDEVQAARATVISMTARRVKERRAGVIAPTSEGVLGKSLRNCEYFGCVVASARRAIRPVVE